jgi:hypothetical protein
MHKITVKITYKGLSIISTDTEGNQIELVKCIDYTTYNVSLYARGGVLLVNEQCMEPKNIIEKEQLLKFLRG